MIQYFFYSLYNLLRVVVNFFIRKTNNSISFVKKYFRTKSVVNLLGFCEMISTIHFNDYFLFQTNKICNIITYCMLTTKLESSNFFPQMLPKKRFAGSHLMSVSPCILFECRINICRCSFIPKDFPLFLVVFTHVLSNHSPRPLERGWG